MATPTIPVFYSRKMVVEDLKSYSPSAGKPTQVVASWQRHGFPILLLDPTPVSVDDLARAHDRQFVLDILNCKTTNGFGNTSRAMAASLPYTSGAMLSAARHAISSGRVAAAPCSGFHHAEFQKSKGYCTFNGLMVAACALKHGGVKRIGILDLDMHHGDGTDHIIGVIGAQDWIRHFTGGAHFFHAGQAPDFFARLPGVLASMQDCDVVLYQAGADPHVNDPQGGWLTTVELRHRDAVVFETLAAMKVPVAWDLAGGYQVERNGSIPKVLEIHDNTMRECVRVFASA